MCVAVCFPLRVSARNTLLWFHQRAKLPHLRALFNSNSLEISMQIDPQRAKPHPEKYSRIVHQRAKRIAPVRPSQLKIEQSTFRFPPLRL
jgi:hypothetical protein